MFGFFVKKSFFDMWDNLLAVILLNLGFYAVFAAILGLIFGLGELSLAVLPAKTSLAAFLSNLVILALSGALLGVYTGAASVLTGMIADYTKPTFGDFVKALQETWQPSLLFGVIQGALLVLILNAASVYLNNMQNLLSPVLFFVLFWLYLMWVMASQYFYALQSRFDKKLRKNIRKMFIMFFDNPVFTILVLTLLSVFVFGLSMVFFFIIPGMGGILLMQSVGLKLRVLKYDYLEEHPRADRKKIPWQVLLAPDRERVGTRTLKGMFFPWKE
jgi:uncharacterized membrane protein YesL